MKVVICGGGIIGSSIAYHLAQKGVKSTVVERCEPACAASGKAGGFLARDWCDSYELGPLARRGFDLHMKMSTEEAFKDCEYRRLDTLSLTVKDGKPKAAAKQGTLPQWVDGAASGVSELGSTATTAQVHPYKLTKAFLKIAQELVGTEVVMGTVNGVEIGNNKITGVKVDGETLEADVVVMTLGPWSHLASKWFKLPQIEGQRAHSIIIQAEDITPHALFLEYKPSGGLPRSPEVYPRPDGTVYMCGMSDQEPLPESAALVTANDKSCDTLFEISGHVSSALAHGSIAKKQACFLPISPDGLPLVGAIPGPSGAYIATGHSCWGILNAPSTGEAMAELLVDGKASTVDIGPYNPARFSH